MSKFNPFPQIHKHQKIEVKTFKPGSREQEQKL